MNSQRGTNWQGAKANMAQLVEAEKGDWPFCAPSVPLSFSPERIFLRKQITMFQFSIIYFFKYIFGFENKPTAPFRITCSSHPCPDSKVNFYKNLVLSVFNNNDMLCKKLRITTYHTLNRLNNNIQIPRLRHSYQAQNSFYSVSPHF